MSDAIKWGILVAGIIGVIALVVAIGFQEYIALGPFVTACDTIVSYASKGLSNARGLINNFFFKETLPAVTFVISWVILKPFITFSIKVIVSIYHYIFK